MPPELAVFIITAAASVTSHNDLGLDLVVVLKRRSRRRVWHGCLVLQFFRPLLNMSRHHQVIGHRGRVVCLAAWSQVRVAGWRVGGTGTD